MNKYNLISVAWLQSSKHIRKTLANYIECFLGSYLKNILLKLTPVLFNRQSVKLLTVFISDLLNGVGNRTKYCKQKYERHAPIFSTYT